MENRFSAILFDLDGTLVDSGRLIAASVIKTFEEYALPVPTPEAVIAYMGIPIEVYFKELGGSAYEGLDADAVFARYRAHFHAMLQEGLLKPFEGVPEMLETLRARNIKVGIATSKATKPAVTTCECAGIHGLIDVYVGSDLVKAYKPAPDTVHKCLEQLGMQAGPHICVVGDAEGDIGMGRGAGATTCGVTWGAHDAARLSSQSPDFIAANMAQLKGFLGI